MVKSSVLSDDLLDSDQEGIRVSITGPATGSTGFLPAAATGFTPVAITAAHASLAAGTFVQAISAENVGVAGAGIRVLKATNTDTTSYLYLSFDAGVTHHWTVTPGQADLIDLAAIGLEISGAAIHWKKFSTAGAGSYFLSALK
jgi:hypothetical protein